MYQVGNCQVYLLRAIRNNIEFFVTRINLPKLLCITSVSHIFGNENLITFLPQIISNQPHSTNKSKPK